MKIKIWLISVFIHSTLAYMTMFPTRFITQKKAFYFRLFTTEVAKKNIVFLGTPAIAAESLKVLNDLCTQTRDTLNYNIICSVSQPPSASGKHRKILNSPVHILSESLGIPVLHPETAKDPLFIEKLKGMDIDLCITAGYGNYLPKAFLEIPKFGTINIHPSLLPKYRGAAPMQRCLQNGDKETGVSLLYTTAKMDGGPILKQINIPLQGDEKTTELLLKTFTLGAQVLFDLLPSVFNGTAIKTPQNEELATTADKIESSEALINFKTMSATQIHNRCRAFSEWPGIYAYFSIANVKPKGIVTETFRYKMLTTKVLSNEFAATSEGEGTQVVGRHAIGNTKKKIISVTCGDGSVLGIQELQPSNGKMMDSTAFCHGLRDTTVVKWVDIDTIENP